jgi:hypothetical protein
MITAVLVVLTLATIYLLAEVQIEKKRNRVLQAFLAGVIKSISDYVSETDVLDALDDIDPAKNTIGIYNKQLPIPYKELLQNIKREFEKDFWTQPYWKWIRKDRNLFYEGKYANDGFNMIYWDFFDNAVADIKKEGEKDKQMNCQQNASLDRQDAPGSR